MSTEASGAAFDERGQAQSSMGVDAEDCDGDGRPELFVTNFQNEHIAYYQNMAGSTVVRTSGVPPALYRESSAEVGLAADSKPWVGWGCALADLDNDGWPDCFVANGHVDDNRSRARADHELSRAAALVPQCPGRRAMRRRPLVGGSSSRPAMSGLTSTAGTSAAAPPIGDLDNDGDIDIVVNHMDGAPAILRNDTPGDNAWICLKLVGTRSNRDAIGARVEIDVDGRTITRQRKGGCSMQSTNDPRSVDRSGASEEHRQRDDLLALGHS